MKGIAGKEGQDITRVPAECRTRLNMSPNLSETRIVWPFFVSPNEVGRFGRSLVHRMKVDTGYSHKCRCESEPLAAELRTIQFPYFELLVLSNRDEMFEFCVDCREANWTGFHKICYVLFIETRCRPFELSGSNFEFNVEPTSSRRYYQVKRTLIPEQKNVGLQRPRFSSCRGAAGYKGTSL